MPEYIIGLTIKAKSEDAAIQQAAKRLGTLHEKQLQVVKGATAGKVAFAGFGSSIKSAFLSVIGPLATVGGIISQIIKGAKGWLAEQKAFRQVGAAATQVGQDADEARAATEILTTALREFGFAEEEVAAGVATLTAVTDDYKQAISAASLAADIAKKKGWEYGRALDFVKKTIAASPRALQEAQREFGIHARTHEELIRKLETDYRGYVSTVTGIETELTRAQSRWDEFWEGIGEGAVKAAARGLGFFDMIQKTGNAILTGKDDWQQYWRTFIDEGDPVQVWYTKFLKTIQEGAGVPEAGAFPKPEDYFRGVEGEEPLAIVPGREAIEAAEQARLRLADTTVKAVQSEINAYAKSTGAQEKSVAAAERNYDVLTDLIDKRLSAELKAIDAHEQAALNSAVTDGERAAISAQADVDRTTARRAAVAEEIELEGDLTDAIRRENAERERLAIEATDAEIALNKARIETLRARAADPNISAASLSAIEAEIAAIQATTAALEQENIQRRTRAEMKAAEAAGAAPDAVAAIGAAGEQQAKLADEARATEIQSDANLYDEKLKHLLSYGETAYQERQRLLKDDLAAIDIYLAAVRKGSAEEMALLRARAGLQALIAKETALQAIDTASAVVGAAQAAWPESKAIAMAAAVVNTARAVTEALPNIPLAAIIGALGAVQIAKIASTNPGGGGGMGANFNSGQTASEKAGFDNPVHDRMARVAGQTFGRRSSQDMVNHFLAGANLGLFAGLRDAVSGPGGRGPVDRRTINNTTTQGGTVVNNNSFLWGPPAQRGSKHLGRLTDRAGYASRRSLVASTTPPTAGGA